MVSVVTPRRTIMPGVSSATRVSIPFVTPACWNPVVSSIQRYGLTRHVGGATVKEVVLTMSLKQQHQRTRIRDRHRSGEVIGD